MLSYPIDEAEELLASKISIAKQSLGNCEEDLDFLREQITVRIPSFHDRPSSWTMRGYALLLDTC